MPIKAMTEKQQLRFPCIGKIRKGAPKPEGSNRPGKDLKWFRPVFDEHETEAAQKFHEYYGDQPNDIRIIFPFNELDWIWDFWLEGYTAGRLVARTDGEYFQYQVDTETGDILVRNWIDMETKKRKPYIEGEPVGFWKGKGGKQNPVFCSPHGRMKAIIPEIERLAYVEFITTSWYDCDNINAQLLGYQELNNGQLAGIPFIVRRRKAMISTPDPKNKAKRVRREKYLISIETDPEYVRRKLVQLKTLALPDNGLEIESNRPDIPELPAGEDWEEGAYTDEEMMTEASDPDPVTVNTKEPEPKKKTVAKKKPEAKEKETEASLDDTKTKLDDDWVTKYWSLMTDLGWSKKTGQETLDLHDGDFTEAYNYAMEQQQKEMA